MPAFGLLVTAAGVGLLLEEEPPDIAPWLACVGAGIYLAGTRGFLRRAQARVSTSMPTATGCCSARHGFVVARVRH